MTTTSTRFFDELAKLATNAAGAAQGVRREIDTLVKAQVERVLGDLDVVQREEFEAVRDMARMAREENDALKAKLAELEARLHPSHPPAHAAPASAADTPAGSTP
jgi:BMFP domain-containing protein YqiC